MVFENVFETDEQEQIHPIFRFRSSSLIVDF